MPWKKAAEMDEKKNQTQTCPFFLPFMREKESWKKIKMHQLTFLNEELLTHAKAMPSSGWLGLWSLTSPG